MSETNIEITQSFLTGIPAFFSITDPYKGYKRERENNPILKISPNRWLITKYDDALSLLQNPLVSHWGQDPETHKFIFGNHNLMSKTMFAYAPDTSSPYRKKVIHGLASKNLKFEAEGMEMTANKILDSLKSKKNIDFIKEYAHPFSFETISKIIGIPEVDIPNWIKIVENVNGSYLKYIIDQNPNDAAGKEFLNFLKKFVDYKRINLDDDIASALITSCMQEKEDDDFILSLLIFLFYAGHDNMMNFFGNAILAISKNQKVFDEIKFDTVSLSEGIDELLRYDSPVQFFMLFAKDEIIIKETKIEAGSQILVCVGAANRDPDFFENPDEIILNRKPSHLSFGSGAYRCIGSRLANLQATVGLKNFIKAVKSISIPKNGVEWKDDILIQRGPSKLKINISWDNKY